MNTLRRILVFCLAAALVVLAACESSPSRRNRRQEPAEELPAVVNDPPPVRLPPPEILDYRGRVNNKEFPAWVGAWMEGGSAAIEALPGYGNVYAFVSERSGTNRIMLEQWQRNFDPARDFPRLAAERIRRRLLRDLSVSADIAYGRNFELAVKAAYGASYQDITKEDDCWIKTAPGNSGVDQSGMDQYRYFVLAIVPRESFSIQIEELLLRIPQTLSTREENAAFSRVRENLFRDF